MSTIGPCSQLTTYTSRCEIMCMSSVNTIPEIPFPLDLFQGPYHSRPEPPMSEFSQAVAAVWDLQKLQGDVMVRACNNMVTAFEDTTQDGAESYSLPVETVRGLIWSFKIWLAKQQFPIMNKRPQEFSDWRTTLTATYDKLLDIISRDIQNRPGMTLNSRRLQCSGLDVMKLIILNVWSGTSTRQLSLTNKDD
jgi:hypothetical protein